MSDTGPKRGLSFPFTVSLVLFVALLADRWLGAGFLASAAYRTQPLWLVGVILAAFLLWLWVLVAARRRNERFDGPIQTVRGSYGIMQPLLATIFLVIAANLAWQQSLPRWLNAVTAQWVDSIVFATAGEPGDFRNGCRRVDATNPAFGDTVLCLPLAAAQDLRGAPGSSVVVTGPASWFGIETSQYVVVTPRAGT